MSAEKRQILLDVEIGSEDAVKNIADLNKELKANKKNIKDLSKNYEENAEEIAKLEVKNKELSKRKREQITLSQKEETSLTGLRKTLAKLTIERNNLDTSIEGNAKRFDELQESILKTRNEVKKFEEAGGDFRSNVGNYKESVKGALEETSFFGVSLGSLASPAGVIAGVGAALAGLVKLFLETGEGAALAGKANNRLKATFGVLRSATASFFNAIKELDSGIESLQEKFSLLEKAGTAYRVIIGVLTLGTSELVRALVNKLGGAVEDSAKKLDRITGSSLKYSASLRETTKEVALLEKQFAVLSQRANDDTISFNEQQKAQRQALAISLKLGDEKIKQAKIEKGLIDNQIAALKELGKTSMQQGSEYSGLLDQQAQAIAAITAAESEKAQSIADQNEIIRKTQRDRFEQDLDILIDIGNLRIQQNLEDVKNTKSSLQERAMALENARKMNEKFFMQQIALYDEEKISREQLIELTKEESVAKINASLKASGLNEIEIQRFREIIIERRANIQAIKDETTALKEQSMQQDRERAKGLAETIERDKKAQVDLNNFRFAQMATRIEQEKRLQQQILQDETKTNKAKELLIAQSSARIVQLKQAETNAVLSSSASLFGSLSSLAKQNSAAAKGFAIAQATINSYLAFTAALTDKTSPNIVRFAQAAAALAAGLAQVKNIISVDATGGDFSSAAAQQGARVRVIQPRLTDQFSQSAVNANLQAQAISDSILNLPSPVVSVQDINKTQNKVKTRVVESSL